MAIDPTSKFAFVELHREAGKMIAAKVSKKASSTPTLLNRSKRFHTLFQWPYAFGGTRRLAPPSR